MPQRHVLPTLILLPLLCLVAGCGGGGGGGGAPAATPPGSWIAADPGPGFDYALGMDSGADDSTYVCGWFPGTHIWDAGGPTETIRTAVVSNDGFVSRYDPAGQLMWVQQIIGTDFVEPTEIVVLPDGSCVVVGQTSGETIFAPLEPEQTTINTGDVLFLARYLADGTLAWVRTAGDCDVRGICLFPDGTVAFSGLMYGTVVFGPGEANQTSLTATSGFADFVARYTASGDLVWAVSATNGVGNSLGAGVTALADNTAVVVGSFSNTTTLGVGSPGEATFTATGLDDGYIARLSNTGEMMWARHFAGTERELPYGVTTLPNGTVGVIGSVTDISLGLSEGENDGQTITSQSVGFTFVCRYSAAGGLVWSTYIDHEAGAFLNIAGIVAYADNSIGIAGVGPNSVTVDPVGPDRQVLPAFDRSDLFLARYDAAGGLIFARRDGGLGTMARAEGVAAYANGSLGFAGGYQVSFTVDQGGSGETTYAGEPGGTDMIVIRYNPDGSHDG